MKVTKAEKIWLFLTVLFYGLYNFPGLPAYGNSKAMGIHAALTLIPIWIVSYGGMHKIYQIYKLKE